MKEIKGENINRNITHYRENPNSYTRSEDNNVFSFFYSSLKMVEYIPEYRFKTPGKGYYTCHNLDVLRFYF